MFASIDKIVSCYFLITPLITYIRFQPAILGANPI